MARAPAQGTDGTLQSARINALFKLLLEQQAELRHCSAPEHLYAAACVAGFGATAWGIAALNRDKFPGGLFAVPILLAVVGIALTAWAVGRKIRREHNKWLDIRRVRNQIALAIRTAAGMNGLIPSEMFRDGLAPGFEFTISVVWWSAVGASIFCLSLLLQLVPHG